MLSLDRIKTWLVVAAGAALAIGLLLVRFVSIGKQIERADSIVRGKKEEDAFEESITSGHRAAGDKPDSVRKDPHDRANRS